MKHILKCKACGIYTIKQSCPNCNGETLEPRPPKFSPQDQYGEYRRKVKEEKLRKEGLI